MKHSVIVKKINDLVVTGAANIDPGLAVSLMDVGFTVPDNKTYLEVVVIANDPRDEKLSGIERKRGIIRVLYHVPTDGRGSYDAFDLLEEIGANFDKTVNDQGLVFYETPKIGPRVAETDEVIYSLTVRYTQQS